MPPDLDQLDVFFGDLTVNRAYVYARLPRPAVAEGLSLVGQVRGPRCARAETLPATSPLLDLGPGPTLLARALVPDPCFWSPDLPAIYEVSLNLLRGTEIVAAARREIGFRSFGARGRNLVLEGKRVVLRGVQARSASEGSTIDEIRAWHEASAAFVSTNPTAEQLAAASQWGTLVIVEIPESGSAAIAHLRELARFPAVAVAVVNGDLPADFKLSQVAPNLLLAQSLSPDIALGLAPWAQLLLVDARDPLLVQRAVALADLPILAVRSLATPASLAEARAACDLLQRDLAPLGQFAGYMV